MSSERGGGGEVVWGKISKILQLSITFILVDIVGVNLNLIGRYGMRMGMHEGVGEGIMGLLSIGGFIS